jgi:phage tail sheath gpL-like
MAINLIGLPQSWRSPGTYISNIPAGGGGGGIGLQSTMIVAQMQSSGSALPNIPVPVFAQSDVNAQFGSQSQIAQIFAGYRLNDPTGQCYVCPLADSSGGTAASVVVTVAGTATSAGSLTIYINNNATNTLVNVGDTATVVANNFLAQMALLIANVNVIVGVTASAVAGAITFTSIHAGVSVGDVQISVNKGGTANGEVLPPGISATVGALTAGTGDPSLTTALLNITPLPWSFLVCPFSTTTVNGEINTLLSDSVGRWSPTQMMYGDSYNAIRGSLASAVEYGTTIGSNIHMSTLSIIDSQTPIFVAAGIFTGLVANNVRSNPALPIVGVLQGLDAPSLVNRLRRVDENTLLFSGVSPVRVNLSGDATLPRAVQNYQVNDSYLNLETDYLVQYCDTYIREDLDETYAQVALYADGQPITAGAQATTPSLILSHIWCLYANLCDGGYAQELKSFIAGSYVEANIAAGTVSLYLPIVVASQLRILRVLVGFNS